MVLLSWLDFLWPLVWFGFCCCFLVGWVLWGQWVYTAHVAASFLLQTPAELISLLKAFSFGLEDKRGSRVLEKEQWKNSLGWSILRGWALTWAHWILCEGPWKGWDGSFHQAAAVQAASPQTRLSHYETKVKDGYRLLLMAKNVTVLNSSVELLPLFIISNGIFFRYSHQFSQNQKDLSSFFFLISVYLTES